MKRGIIRRPSSASEVAQESTTYPEFGRNLKDFLHEFAFAKKDGRPLLRLVAAPAVRIAGRFTEGRICDAFLAATVDFLSRTNGFPTPQWALDPELMWGEPWFSEESLRVRAFLLRDTPSAFKDKNIFVFESA